MRRRVKRGIQKEELDGGIRGRAMASSMMDGSGSSECFEEQEWYGIAIGVFITLGICVSFVPQVRAVHPSSMLCRARCM